MTTAEERGAAELRSLRQEVIDAAKALVHRDSMTNASTLRYTVLALEKVEAREEARYIEERRILDGYFDQDQLPFCHSVSLFWPHTGKEGRRDYYDMANREALFEFILYDLHRFQGEDPVVLWYDPSGKRP